MKLTVQSNPVHAVGGSNRKNVSIAANGKAFRALTNNLYQNKIGSIVREISANAVDAQRVANNLDIPFEVHLPDAFEPWFSVRDFGIGLSPEIMDDVFLTMFESTKDQTNDHIGAFGLGSKTPLAYTDQYSIVSYIDGIARMYSIFTENTGDLQCLEMGTFETTEPNGVEVKLNVLTEDFYKFKNEVVAQLSFFPILPTIRNGEVEWNTMGSAIYSTDDVHISTCSSSYSGNPINIIQGGVCYPLSLQNLRNNLTPENLTFIEIISRNMTYLFFDIGMINVTISRESIEYDKRTIDNINDKLTIIREGLSAYITDKLENFENDWQCVEYINSNNSIYNLARATGFKRDNVDFNDYACIATYNTDGTAFIINAGTDDVKCVGGLYKVSNTHRTRKNNSVRSLRPRGDVVIYIKDTNSRPNIRYDWHVANFNSGKDVYIVNPVNIAYAQKCRELLIEALGGFNNIVMLSDIDVPKSERVSRSYTRPTYYSYDSSCGGTNSITYWKKEYESLNDIVDDVAYVVVKGVNIIDNGYHDYAPLNIENESCFHTLRQYNMWDDVEVIGIREKDAEKLKDRPNFIPLNEMVNALCDEKYKELMKYKVAAKRIAVLEAIEGSKVMGAHALPDAKIEDIKSKNNIFVRISALYDKLKKKNDNYIPDELKHVCRNNFYNHRAIWTKKINECITKRYPLLYALGEWDFSHNVTHDSIVDYINMLDSRQGV